MAVPHGRQEGCCGRPRDGAGRSGAAVVQGSGSSSAWLNDGDGSLHNTGGDNQRWGETAMDHEAVFTFVRADESECVLRLSCIIRGRGRQLRVTEA